MWHTVNMNFSKSQTQTCKKEKFLDFFPPKFQFNIYLETLFFLVAETTTLVNFWPTQSLQVLTEFPDCVHVSRLMAPGNEAVSGS